MTDGVTLRDALKLAPLGRARVVAGVTGLERLVRHVNVMEVPDIDNWVKADQLLLTTGYPLRNDPSAIADLVPRLAERGLAGLAVKPARYIDAIPSSMIEAADRLGFPLIELPLDTSFDDVITAVMGIILNEQSLRLRSSVEINNHFVRIALGGGGLPEIVFELQRLALAEAAIVDPRGGILARSSSEIEAILTRTGLDWSGLLATSDACQETVTPTGLILLVKPIRVGSELHGGVVLAVEQRGPTNDDRFAIEHAATVAAMRLVQSRAIASADRRFHAVCLEELVTGHVTDRNIWTEWAREFGWNSTVSRAVLLAELRSAEGSPPPGQSVAPEAPWWTRSMADAASRVLGEGTIVWERQASIAVLAALKTPGNAWIKEMAARLQAEARWRFPSAVLAIGVGRTYDDPLQLSHSYDEALQALVVGKRLGVPGQVWLFEDLGVDRLLLSCPPSELSAFRDATIGRLHVYDRDHHTSLVGTLETFLACNRNATVAARSLYVHYNTIAHRLERIAEVIGPFADDPDRCLSLHLALRIQRLISR